MTLTIYRNGSLIPSVYTGEVAEYADRALTMLAPINGRGDKVPSTGPRP